MLLVPAIKLITRTVPARDSLFPGLRLLQLFLIYGRQVIHGIGGAVIEVGKSLVGMQDIKLSL